MVIKINIPEALAAQAREQGLSVEAYAEKILLEQAAASQTEHSKLRTPEQIRTWLDSVAQFSDKIPALPETISREWIYQDHD